MAIEILRWGNCNMTQKLLSSTKRHKHTELPLVSLRLENWRWKPHACVASLADLVKRVIPPFLMSAVRVHYVSRSTFVIARPRSPIKYEGNGRVRRWTFPRNQSTSQADREREENREREEKTEKSNFLARARRPARFKGRKSRDSICAAWVMKKFHAAANWIRLWRSTSAEKVATKKLPCSNGKLRVIPWKLTAHRVMQLDWSRLTYRMSFVSSK